MDRKTLSDAVVRVHGQLFGGHVRVRTAERSGGASRSPHEYRIGPRGQKKGQKLNEPCPCLQGLHCLCRGPLIPGNIPACIFSGPVSLDNCTCTYLRICPLTTRGSPLSMHCSHFFKPLAFIQTLCLFGMMMTTTRDPDGISWIVGNLSDPILVTPVSPPQPWANHAGMGLKIFSPVGRLTLQAMIGGIAKSSRIVVNISPN